MTNTAAAAHNLTVTRPAYADRPDSKPVAGIAKCKCKAAKRVDGFVWRAYAGYGRMESKLEWPTVVCSCGRQYPMITRIVATTTEHKCDARCTHAKGHNCECSCGGKNHGSGL